MTHKVVSRLVSLLAVAVALLAALFVAAPAGATEVTAEAAPRAAKELPYEFQWQQNGYYCGPAAVRMALTSRGFYPSQDHLAGQLGTDENGTDSAADTTRVLNAEGGGGYYETKWIPGQSATPAEIDLLRHDVVYDIDRGYPIVANIVGDAMDTDGDWHSYSGGHYLVITGYSEDGNLVKIADSADANGVGWYWMETTRMAHWIAARGYSA